MNSIIAEAKAEYNRSQRQWIVANTDGQIIDVLPPKHKQEAQLAALRHNNPMLASEVEAIIENNRLHPEARAIERRAIKAGLIIEADAVLAPRNWHDDRYHAGEVGAVISQSGNGTYSVYFSGCTAEPGFLDCECPDHGNALMREYYPPSHPRRPRFGAPVLFNGQVACKHILAVLISEILGA